MTCHAQLSLAEPSPAEPLLRRLQRFRAVALLDARARASSTLPQYVSYSTAMQFHRRSIPDSIVIDDRRHAAEPRHRVTNQPFNDFKKFFFSETLFYFTNTDEQLCTLKYTTDTTLQLCFRCVRVQQS